LEFDVQTKRKSKVDRGNRTSRESRFSRGQAPGRSDEEIVAEALELINPPSGQRETTRSEVLSTIHRVRTFAQGYHCRQSPSEQKEQLELYLKNLRATKRTFVRVGWQPEGEFLTHLNAEIARIKSAYDFRAKTTPKAGKRWDWVALMATAGARLSIPDQRITLTTGGPWHLLSILFYEAATGKPNCDHVLKYMAVLQDGRAHPEVLRGW
jgi:hypothetical protein